MLLSFSVTLPPTQPPKGSITLQPQTVNFLPYMLSSFSPLFVIIFIFLSAVRFYFLNFLSLSSQCDFLNLFSLGLFLWLSILRTHSGMCTRCPQTTQRTQQLFFLTLSQLHAKYGVPINHSGFLPPFLVCWDAVSTKLGKTQGGSCTSRSNYGTSISHVLLQIGKQPLNCLDGLVGKAKLNQNLRKLIVFTTGGRFYGSWLVKIRVYGSF